MTEKANETIRAAREALGWSQKELARRVGVRSVTTVYYWEREESPRYPLDAHRKKLERVLGVKLPPKA